jgi:hypothetical protein
MEILKALITCCGAALVTGIFSVILANKSTKKERQAQDNAVMDKLNALDKKLDAHIQEDTESKTDEARGRVLHFGDEVRRGIQHTEEHWADILHDIDRYEDYCDTHPNYENNRATHTIHYLKGVYDEHLRKNDFLK